MIHKNIITISRKYAKAAFDFAYENKQIDEWKKMFNLVIDILYHKEIYDNICYINSNIILGKIIIEICNNKIDKYFQNYISILANNHRLFNLDEIFNQFTIFCNSFNSIIDINIISAWQLNNFYKNKITVSMERFFSSKVKITYLIDKSIIAGIIIQVGDLIIDSSIRNKIKNLSNILL